MANSKIDDNRKPSLIGVSSADGATPVRAEINPTSGGLLVESTNPGKLVTESFDYIEVTEGATTDVFVYKTGGSSGTTVATVTVTYTTSDKDILDNIART